MRRLAEDSGTIERLARLGELWSVVRYFHPWLPYRAIDWDGAGSAAAERLIGSCGSGVFGSAVEAMLATLDDPVTRLLPTEEDPAAPAVRVMPLSRWLAGDVLCWTLNRATLGPDLEKANESLKDLLPQVLEAKHVLLDLREKVRFDGLGVLFRASRLETALLRAPLRIPGERLRMHNGLRGGFSRSYHSGFQVEDGEVVAPCVRSFDGRIAVLVNEATTIPRVVAALQHAGWAVVIGAGPVSDESLVRTHDVELEEGLRVRVRLGDLVYADGTTGFAPGVTVPGATMEGADDQAIRTVVDLLRGPAVRSPEAGPRRTEEVEAGPSAGGSTSYPCRGDRTLAVFEIWSTIHYFFPYRDLMERDWGSVLREYLPQVIDADDTLGYHLAIARMYSHIGDSHGKVQSATLEEHFGACPSAVYVRWIGGQPVIAGFRDEAAARAAGVGAGDSIIEVDGEAVAARIERYLSHLAASSPQSAYARAADAMLFGADGSAARVAVVGSDGRHQGGGRPRSADIPRKASYRHGFSYRSGDVVRLLRPRVGYMDLDRLRCQDVDAAFEQMSGTRAIVFDMRGYPRGTAWEIAPRLARKPKVSAALFRRCLLLGPSKEGRQHYSFVQELPLLAPHTPSYSGRTVMLMDERTVSQAEHTGLFLEAANGTTFIGSRTAGANGDVTSFTVRGGIKLHFSGQSVQYADGRQLQRIGLVPDLEVEPTVEGIREGRDEVLEAALRFLDER